MMITIPLPIPVPAIIVDRENNRLRIDKTSTELAKRERELGKVMTFDEEKSLPLCCACKEPKAHFATTEPPEGYRWGGWFCDYCLGQGRLAKSVSLVIDQLTCTIEKVVVFDKSGMAHDGYQPL